VAEPEEEVAMPTGSPLEVPTTQAIPSRDHWLLLKWPLKADARSKCDGTRHSQALSLVIADPSSSADEQFSALV
jgi:hypothetical protein